MDQNNDALPEQPSFSIAPKQKSGFKNSSVMDHMNQPGIQNAFGSLLDVHNSFHFGKSANNFNGTGRLNKV